ncbi:MAG: NADH-quinone oxidoreductase subunit NuoG [Anaerolineaceae bacterium]
MLKQISLTIDNITVKAPENTLIIDAAKLAGIDIPVFCYHPCLKPVGMCRVCLVEVGRPIIDRATGVAVTEADGSPKIQFGPKLETACTTPISAGMVVLVNSEKSKAARNEILEFLLTSHPLDCPVCDKGGECPLQNLTLAYGPGKSRFKFDEKEHLAKNVPLGELILLDRERCIQCGRCVRYQTEIVDDPVIGFYQRSRLMQIITRSDPGFDSYFSGNTTDICPVGALTSTDFRFGARPWEMKSAASVCTHCPVGCNLTIDVRRDAKSGGGIAIKRIMPRQNGVVNDIWICDKGRFAHHFADKSNRITKPLIRKGNALKPASLETVLDLVASKIRSRNKKLVTLVGGRLSNEDLYNLKQLTEKLHGSGFLYGDMAGGEFTCQLGLTQGASLSDLKQGSVILVIASDLHEEAPIYWLRVKQAVERGATLIIVNPRETRLDKYAAYKIPYRYGDEIASIKKLILGKSGLRHPAAKVIQKAQALVVVVGNEGLGQKSSRAVMESAAQLFTDGGFAGKTGSGLVAVWKNTNTQGAWEMGFDLSHDLQKTIRAADVLLIAGADPVGDRPELEEAMRYAGFVVVLELAPTATTNLAHVVIPVQAFSEREGTYTSAERRVQIFYPAVGARDDVLPDHKIVALLAGQLGISLPGESARQVFEHISGDITGFKGLSYQALCTVPDQWPGTGGKNKYFSGTVSANQQGVGVQLVLNPHPSRFQPIERWEKGQAAYDEKKLWAVPVTRLYDRGNTLLPTKLLERRMVSGEMRIHPDTAALYGVQSGPVLLSFGKATQWGNCVLDETAPRGFVLIPRSSGIPINEVTAVTLSDVNKSNQSVGNRNK